MHRAKTPWGGKEERLVQQGGKGIGRHRPHAADPLAHRVDGLAVQQTLLAEIDGGLLLGGGLDDGLEGADGAITHDRGIAAHPGIAQVGEIGGVAVARAVIEGPLPGVAAEEGAACKHRADGAFFDDAGLVGHIKGDLQVIPSGHLGLGGRCVETDEFPVHIHHKIGDLLPVQGADDGIQIADDPVQVIVPG